MKSPAKFATSRFCRIAAAFLLAFVLTPAQAQQPPSNVGFGVIEDWSSHRVVFSNPGTLIDAVMSGKRERWEKIVNDPRYQMQQIRRSARTGTSAMTVSPRLSLSSEASPIFSRLGNNRFRERKDVQSLEGKWNVSIAGGGGGPALGMYPAKYTFSPIGAPACSDFVVFPNAIAGASNSSPSIIGLNNLYVGACSPAPSYAFSYFVGTGTVQTSPSISVNGAEVAFVESISGGSQFHVVTIGTSGTNTQTGTFSPVAPCTVIANGTTTTPCSSNNAVDAYVTLNGGVMVTRSSAFIDYGDDIAYVGDDTGKLHKFTPVFNGTPTEVTTGWPVTIAAGVTLSGPTYDGVSGNIFIGGSDGNLYCITSAGASCGLAAVGSGGTGGGIIDAPIVDSTNQTVFTQANNFTSGNVVVSQLTTSMSGQVTANIGVAPSSMAYTDQYDGDFDNAYYTSTPGAVSGYMYFCGDLSSSGGDAPTLWRVTFNSSGTMTGTDSSFTPIALVASGDKGTSYDCTPLTEVYNANLGHDFLFLGVKSGGPSAIEGTATNCSGTTCIISFDLATNPILGLGGTTTPASAGGAGTSALIIDNVSSATGGSQIYYGAPNSGQGEQLSQSSLN